MNPGLPILDDRDSCPDAAPATTFGTAPHLWVILNGLQAVKDLACSSTILPRRILLQVIWLCYN